MRSARQTKPLSMPNSWSEISHSDDLQLTIQHHCNELSSRMFGYHLVKLGALASQMELEQCPISHQVRLCASADKGDVCVDLNHLPLKENSTDAFLLVFNLDFSNDPHQVLREVDRCITENGIVLICGLNPFSLSGISRYSPFYRKHPLKSARFFSTLRVKDWLHLLHYQIIEQRQFYYSSVFAKRPLQLSMSSDSRLREVMTSSMGWSSSVYCIVAKKCTQPMTLIRPKWRTSSSLLNPHPVQGTLMRFKNK